MKTTIKFWAAAAIVALSACNKEKAGLPSLPVVATGKPSSLKTVSTDAFANAANPYDSVGAVHNQALGVVWDYEQKTKDTTARTIRSQVAGFF